MKEDKSKISKDFKTSLHHNHTINMEIYCILVGPDMEAHWAASTKTS